jgi:putative acetyltransferase
VEEVSFTIAAETPLQDDVRMLVAALNEWALEQTPREFCHHMTVEQMAQPDTTVFVARQDGKAIGMGALRRLDRGIGELKRMYTLPETRGLGVAKAIVGEIENLARREGCHRLVLETGAVDGFKSAWRVYEQSGFTTCGAVLDYPADTGHNIYYEKLL